MIRLHRSTIAGAVLLVLLAFVAIRTVAGAPADRVATVLARPADRPHVDAGREAAVRRAVAALAAVDAARARGFADPATADVGVWAHRLCSCAATDRGELVRLRRLGRRLRGVRHVPIAVTTIEATSTRLDLAMTDRLPAYDEIDARGAVVRRWRGRDVARWRLTLVDEGAGWRMREVEAAPATARGAWTGRPLGRTMISTSGAPRAPPAREGLSACVRSGRARSPSVSCRSP